MKDEKNSLNWKAVLFLTLQDSLNKGTATKTLMAEKRLTRSPAAFCFHYVFSFTVPFILKQVL